MVIRVLVLWWEVQILVLIILRMRLVCRTLQVDFSRTLLVTEILQVPLIQVLLVLEIRPQIQMLSPLGLILMREG
ncbi:MAG: hypothetical protein A2496_13580 [Burkholderiales bacterium RIFOXYC12_FULL_60_6]|nr:MAG: hypothetical protein A2496_13580 [Burkholderiales bacterium RIFOXYC12_FULL_60_6]